MIIYMITPVFTPPKLKDLKEYKMSEINTITESAQNVNWVLAALNEVAEAQGYAITRENLEVTFTYAEITAKFDLANNGKWIIEDDGVEIKSGDDFKVFKDLLVYHKTYQMVGVACALEHLKKGASVYYFTVSGFIQLKRTHNIDNLLSREHYYVPRFKVNINGQDFMDLNKARAYLDSIDPLKKGESDGGLQQNQVLGQREGKQHDPRSACGSGQTDPNSRSNGYFHKK